MTLATELFIVRHGETDFNREGIVQGRGVNTALNELGRAQATALARRFANVAIDRIYSSPLKRALETAEYVARDREQAIVCTDEGLEEMSWGVYEGQSPSEQLSQAFAEMRSRWHHGEHDFAVEGGESLSQVQARGLRAIEGILRDHPGKRILVVAHGRFLRILLASLLKEYGIERMEELRHSNTGVNHLIHNGQRFTAITLNCTLHLATPTLASSSAARK